MSYVGYVLPNVAFQGVRTASFNGTGSQTVFTLPAPASSAASIEVVVNNVQQSPYDGSYSVNGSTLTFSEAPSSGTNNIYVAYRDQTFMSTVPGDGSVTPAKLSGGAPYWDGSGNVGVGTTSPTVYGSYKTLEVRGTGGGLLQIGTGATTAAYLFQDGTNSGFNNISNGVMTFGTNNTERMRIDSSGRVTKPYQPAFSVTDMSITIFNANTGAASYMNGGSVNTNVGSCYNSTTGRFTAPVAGKYLITAAVLVFAGTGRLEAQIYINGGNSGFGLNGTGSTYDGPSVTAVLTLAANDYVTVSRVSGTAYPTHGNNNFSGFLIG